MDDETVAQLVVVLPFPTEPALTFSLEPAPAIPRGVPFQTRAAASLAASQLAQPSAKAMASRLRTAESIRRP